jgi:hypothetical protein
MNMTTANVDNTETPGNGDLPETDDSEYIPGACAEYSEICRPNEAVALIATAQAIDPRADSGNIECVNEIGSERRHAVAVTALHSLNDQ